MTMVARVTAARVRLQIDVRFGDAVTPPPVRMDLPVLLDFPMPRLLVYSRETVVAEKLDALVQFGTANSRMKDSELATSRPRHKSPWENPPFASATCRHSSSDGAS